MLLRSGALALVLLLAGVPAAHAAPIFGYNQSFSVPGTAGWGGGIPTIDNPLDGGALGAGDGYLYAASGGGNFAVRCKDCPEYVGNWTAAGITHVGLDLNDVGNPDPLELHLVIGNDTNFWSCNTIFTPPNGAWQRYVVDVSDSTNFTQIIGPGWFADALANVQILMVRHDLAPYIQDPDNIAADFGLDEVTIGDLITPVASGSWGRLKILYR